MQIRRHLPEGNKIGMCTRAMPQCPDQLHSHCNNVLTIVRVQVISTARTCNVILIVLDCLKPISHKRLIEKELEGFGIRLNKTPPGINFRRKDKGGVSLTTTISEPRLDLECEYAEQS